MNIAINGFGRIGRAAFKILLEKKADFKVVAINDLTDPATLAHLLKYDSCYGRFGKEVKAGADNIQVAGRKFHIYAEKDPSLLPWKDLAVDVVLECTGRFRDKESAGAHLKAGAKKVIISAPAKGNIKTVVLGVNEEKLKRTDNIISNASCTTNCLAPVTKIIKENFGIKQGIMTTIHSYTADQNIVDGPHKDLRRARAAAVNIVPTTTGAAVAVTETIPSLKNRFDGMAVRVPTPVGSLVDAVFVTQKKLDVKSVNSAFKKAARSARLQGLVRVSEEPLVVSDIVGESASAVVDLGATMVVGQDLLKVIAWYDNEWGYSNRLVELALYLRKKRLL